MTSVVARGGKPGRGKGGGVGRGSKNSFPPPEPSSPRSHSLQPDSTGNSLHKYPIFYICVYMYINDTPVKGLEKTTGMKVFQMLCLLDRKKGVEGFIRVAQAI